MLVCDVQAVVVLAWLGLLAVGIAGAAQMRLEPDVNNFIPDGSYLKCASMIVLGPFCCV